MGRDKDKAVKGRESAEEAEACPADENYYMEILNYYKRIKEMILTGDLLEDEQGCEALVDRIIEDMRKKDVEIFLMSDQRCSKIFELMLSINILSIKRLIDSVSLETLEEGGRMLEENDNFKRLKTCISNYIFILKSILEQVEQSIFDLYGSHVTETALESSAILLSFLKNKPVFQSDRKLILEEVQRFVRRMSTSLGWISILTNSAASHVGRTVINISLGKVTMSMDNMETYILENVGKRNQANKQKFSGRSSNKYKTHECSGILELREMLFSSGSEGSSLSDQLFQSLKDDFEGVIGDTYALPSLILFVRALFELKTPNDEGISRTLNKFLTIIITNGQEEEEDIISEFEKGHVESEKISRLLSNLTKSWISSNLKSRLLELLLDIIPYEFLVIWVNSHTYSKNENEEVPLSEILESEYGHYVILNLLRSNRIRREELIPILKSLDFSQLLSRKDMTDILISLMDNCRRLQSEYKYLTKRLWKAFEISSSEDYQYTFSCLIFQKNKSELVQQEEARPKITSQGCQMISSLSKFPADTIHPLTSGITYFISKHKETMLKDILETPFGIRMTETIVSSSSNFPQSLKKRWIQSYFGNFLSLVLSGTCNYAIIAMFYASDNLFRKMIVEELLNEEQGGGKDVIMSKNFKIFKSLKIESFSKKDDWNNVNEKIDKTRKLFSDIIDDNPNNPSTKEIHSSDLSKKNKNKKTPRNHNNHDDVTDDHSMGSILQFIKKSKK
ncbi:putative transmembrane domain-containing protein [Cryptosporidium canis]|uniref:Transmembrane domain-containing protein n=1 Tax=Cryptosporidium canis TaxID=195482 RepID=A0ABQ8P4V6_9CRYT|nr:putative transmembrane domain-containing protein [Cryptosporidium canis]KAJ1609899.1 putative transmembrane domain-containing protein [Cryptosporidium canis]